MSTAEARRDLMGRALTGALWVNASVFTGKLLVLLSTAILARLLSKEEFGVAGYATVMIGFLDVFTGVGVSPALIYHRDDARTADTAFILSVIAGALLFLAGWAIAPAAAYVFRDPRATAVTRVLALVFPLAGLAEIHDARLLKALQFKRKLVPDVSKSFVKGVASILFAVAGFGAWSLILGQLAGTAAFAIACWGVHPWRPSWRFDLGIAAELLHYGGRIIAVSILGILLLNCDYLLIGRYLGAAALGVYALAFRLPELLIKQFSQAVSRVLFPTYASVKEDADLLRRGFLDTTRLVSLVTVPLGLGMALVAEPLVNVVFSAKWADAIPVLRLTALYMLLRALTFNAGDVYKAQGRPGILVRLSALRLVVLLPALFWAVLRVGTLTSVATVQVVVAGLGSLLNLVVASRVLELAPAKLAQAYIPALASGCIMTTAVAITQLACEDWHPVLQLALLVPLGAGVYALSASRLCPGVMQQTVAAIRGVRSQRTEKGT